MGDEQQYHVGLTIGPIYATLLRTSTPAGMWFVSTMFSEVSAALCKKMTEQGIEETQIYSPYYSKRPIIAAPDGVGLYNDRILLTANGAFLKIFPHCIATVKREFAAYFSHSLNGCEKEQAEAFMEEWLEIHFVSIPLTEIGASDSPVAALNEALDMLELQQGYLYQTDDTLLKILLDGEAEELGAEKPAAASQNRFLKQCFLMRKDPTQPYHFLRNAIYPQIQKRDTNQAPLQGLRNVLDIAERQDAYDKNGVQKPLPKEKHRRYLAVVKADGDRMGQFVAKLQGMPDIREFSRCCLKYGAEAAQRIGEYGGATIFAGGDDLLFLAPVDRILELCGDINERFHENMGAFFQSQEQVMEAQRLPSLSFGVQICFYGYPLYESLKQAGALLQKAKEQGGDRIALSLQKAAGKELQFVLQHHRKGAPPNTLQRLRRLMDQYITDVNERDRAERCIWLQPAVHTVGRHKAIFQHALKNDIPAAMVFKNLFHQELHQSLAAEQFLKDAANLMEFLAQNTKGTAASELLRQYDVLLRFMQFYLEKGEEKC